MNVLLSGAFNEHAEMSAERLDAYLRKRRSELECGMDIDAMVDSIDESDMGEYLTEFTAAALTPDVDRRLLKLREITDRMVKNTLANDKARWRDE